MSEVYYVTQGNGTRVITDMADLVRHYNTKVRRQVTGRDLSDSMNEVADIAMAIKRSGGPDLDCISECPLPS